MNERVSVWRERVARTLAPGVSVWRGGRERRATTPLKRGRRAFVGVIAALKSVVSARGERVG